MRASCEAAMAVQLLEQSQNVHPPSQSAAAIAKPQTGRLYSGQGWLHTTINQVSKETAFTWIELPCILWIGNACHAPRVPLKMVKIHILKMPCTGFPILQLHN